MNKKQKKPCPRRYIPYDLVREDGRLERTCEHGIGHTVGHKDESKLKDWSIWVHGCDGCCNDYRTMENPT